jgi:hypothetical protein
MSNVVLVVISVMGLFMIYLGIAATLCVVRDRSLARGSAVSRYLGFVVRPALGSGWKREFVPRCRILT